jgi:hypothetical protein
LTNRINAVGRLPNSLGRLGIVYIKSGKIEEARKLLPELESIVKKGEITNAATSIAWILGALGENDEAFEWLEIAVKRREPSLIESNHVPFLDPLRDDPRFEVILKKVGFPP